MSGKAPAIGRRSDKDALFEGFAKMARALSSGRRGEIIEVLAQGERTVEQVAESIEQTLANTSHHLRALAEAGLVVATKQGRHVAYRLASDRVYDLWSALRDVAEAHLAELARLTDGYLGDRSEIETISHAEFEARRRKHEITIIDVRPSVEYEAGHVTGAISLPPTDLEQRLGELPTDRDIVAYCRSPYCSFADQAVRALRARGIAAYRLEGGYPEWRRARAAGL